MKRQYLERQRNMKKIIGEKGMEVVAMKGIKATGRSVKLSLLTTLIYNLKTHCLKRTHVPQTTLINRD